MLRSPVLLHYATATLRATARGRNTPRFLEAEAGQVRDAAVRVSGVSGGHGHPEGSEGGERAARLAAHVQRAYAGRRRLPRMLHGAARELRPYDETDAFGWRLLQLAARGQYAAEPLMCCAAAAEEGCLLLLTDLRLLCATVEGGRLLWHVPLREARAAHTL